MQTPHPPSLRLRCRLLFHTMPMGNSLLMMMMTTTTTTNTATNTTPPPPPSETSSLPGDSGGACPQTALQPFHPQEEEKPQLVDAHQVAGISVEQAIEGVSNALPLSMPLEELMLRRQMATSVLITMGRKVTHFEGDIDPTTGTVDVDHVFQPILLEDEHLANLHVERYDPAATTRSKRSVTAW